MAKREYGYVEVHGSGFPLLTVPCGSERETAIEAANSAYWTAVNTVRAHGVRFGVLDDKGHVRGKLVMVKSHRKFTSGVGPFA